MYVGKFIGVAVAPRHLNHERLVMLIFTHLQDREIEFIFATLLFVWNILTVSMTVSTTIPLHQDPLGVDVAGLQGMQ